MDLDRLRAAYEQVKGELLAERTEDGHWIGELSSSALSTATAVSALAVVKASGGREPPEAPLDFDSLISRGVSYLVTQQNSDGGFGDTDLSHSNIATTYLVVAALHLAGVADRHSEPLARANAYIDSKGRLAGLRERYGIDKTFVVPIMTNLALAGLIDWREIDPLPFELACVPQSLYRFVGMPVVSYAIPALVAIGQARHFHAPPRNPITRLVRWLSITRSLKVLRRMQPDSGGYLEATPLTSFVVMSLASCGPLAPRAADQSNDVNAHHFRSRSERTTEFADAVIRDGVKFLANSIRPDGSWPIDTNLATWNTTLAINALAGAGEDLDGILGHPLQINEFIYYARDKLGKVPGSELVCDKALPDIGPRPSDAIEWLLTCQHLKEHEFTGAKPGGFGWSDLPGAVPDADDTPGAMLALTSRIVTFKPVSDDDSAWVALMGAWTLAIKWLIELQNRDGGWPTFCRGWGRLPFDRSGVDLTAHVVRALSWDTPDKVGFYDDEERISRAIKRAISFIRRCQHPDGSWSPLWFGNQDHPEEDNPVYGTAKVLFAYRDLGLMDSPEAQRGVAWLVANQNADGGWGIGVWDRARKAKPGKSGGVESGQGVAGLGRTGESPGTEHSVPGTQYSVLSTQYRVHQCNDQPMSPPRPEPRVPCLLTSSVEETALAVEALLAALNPEPRTLKPEPIAAVVEKGLTWLVERVERGEHRQPAPIGFYFAKLWYYERLYPLTFTVAALGRACRQFSGRQIDCLSIAHPASTGTTPWTTAAP